MINTTLGPLALGPAASGAASASSSSLATRPSNRGAGFGSRSGIDDPYTDGHTLPEGETNEFVRYQDPFIRPTIINRQGENEIIRKMDAFLDPKLETM
ncbi:MAG: hypothetical protein P8N50_00010 [Actinomycetota bacterium]|jgi:hypothetical protein|nr:hypothetical protein [Actinomycetota bacterium]